MRWCRSVSACWWRGHTLTGAPYACLAVRQTLLHATGLIVSKCQTVCCCNNSTTAANTGRHTTPSVHTTHSHMRNDDAQHTQNQLNDSEAKQHTEKYMRRAATCFGATHNNVHLQRHAHTGQQQHYSLMVQKHAAAQYKAINNDHTHSYYSTLTHTL